MEVMNLPIQLNFARVVLDMDKQEDVEEYNRIMTYAHAGYGMQIIYLNRQFIKKVSCKNGKKKRALRGTKVADKSNAERIKRLIPYK